MATINKYINGVGHTIPDAPNTPTAGLIQDMATAISDLATSAAELDGSNSPNWSAPKASTAPPPSKKFLPQWTRSS